MSPDQQAALIDRLRAENAELRQQVHDLLNQLMKSREGQ